MKNHLPEKETDCSACMKERSRRLKIKIKKGNKVSMNKPKSKKSVQTSQQQLLIYLDGEFVPKSEAKISVFDHGLLYGDGVFEGIRSYNCLVFKLKEHLIRLAEY